ncbi:hypothetical protein ACFLTP_02460 [Chloroflexota bacterium]
MRLSRYQRETIIVFNEAENFATIFTYRKGWQRYFEAIGRKPYRINRGGREYRCPKSWIKLPKPARKHTITSSDIKQGTLFSVDDWCNDKSI